MKHFLSIIALVLSFNAIGQLPPPVCGDPSVRTYFDPITCMSPCATLHAAVVGENPVNSGIVMDDIYSNIIPIGFNFTFYGAIFNTCVISPNGMITFNNALANTPTNWAITAALLGNPTAFNSICGPWCDMDPTVAGSGPITFSTSGLPPNRRFTVSWCHVFMFGCNDQWTTSQIVLYETCNLIDVHVGHKTICATWNDPPSPPNNGGRAIIGVENATGTAATVAPGSNFPAAYTCTNVSWRFTPIAGPSYSVTSIPYAPVPNAAAPINWFSGATGGTLLGTGPVLPCVPLGATYRAEVAGCDATSTSIISTIPPPSITNATINVCVGSTATVTVPLPPGGIWAGGPASVATLNTTTNVVTGINEGTATYIYNYVPGCLYKLTVNVTLCCSDTCAWTVLGNNIHNGHNIFGTLTNDDIRIVTNNTQRAVIKSNGFMGINQSAPNTTLDVNCNPPTGTPSGLQFENLPTGHGNALVVDPNGFVYVAQSVLYRPAGSTDVQDQIDNLKQQLEEVKAQLNMVAGIPLDNSGGNTLTVTPNPSDGKMNISYTIAGTFSNAAIKITDSQGRLMVTRTVNNNTGTANVTLPSSVASGEVIVALVVDNKIVAKQKEVLVK